jgi:hypothetical protein
MFENISEITWARLGAYMDGEGHIGIARCDAFHDGDKRAYTQYALNLNVTNTHPRILEFFAKNVPEGNTSGDSRKIFETKGEAWKRSGKWFITGKEKQRGFLLGIKPFIEGKQELVDLALKYLALPVRTRNPELREQMYQESRKLNDKGPQYRVGFIKETKPLPRRKFKLDTKGNYIDLTGIVTEETKILRG